MNVKIANPPPRLANGCALYNDMTRPGAERKIANSLEEIQEITVAVDGKTDARYCLWHTGEADERLPVLDCLSYFERDLLDTIYTILRPLDDATSDKTTPPPAKKIELAEIASRMGLKPVWGRVGPLGLRNSQGIGNRTNYLIQIAIMQLFTTGIAIDATAQAKKWGKDIKQAEYASTMISGVQVLLEDYHKQTIDGNTTLERQQQYILISPSWDPYARKYSYVASLPVYHYAENMGGHIATVAGGWYLLPGSATSAAKKLNAYLRRVLLVAVYSRRQTGRSTKTLRESTIMSRVWGEEKVSHQAKNKRIEKIADQLDIWIDQGLIKGYDRLPSASRTVDDTKWVIYLPPQDEKQVK